MDSFSRKAVVAHPANLSNSKDLARVVEQVSYGGRNYRFVASAAKNKSDVRVMNAFQGLCARCFQLCSSALLSIVRALNSFKGLCARCFHLYSSTYLSIPKQALSPVNQKEGIGPHDGQHGRSAEPATDVQRQSLALISSEDLTTLGLKMGRETRGNRDECAIPTSLEGWEHLAAFNRYGIIPEETIIAHPELETVARSYNEVAMSKREEWIGAHPGYMKFEKTSKLGLRQLRLYKQEGGSPLGSGYSKEVISASVRKPDTSASGFIDKTKAVAFQGLDLQNESLEVKTERVQNEFQHEYTVLTALKKAGVQHLVQLTKAELPGTSQSVIVMKKYNARTLSDYLANCESMRIKKHLLIEAAEGLAGMHGAGYVHGDFKLENILVEQQGGVSVYVSYARDKRPYGAPSPHEEIQPEHTHAFLSDFGLTRRIGDAFPADLGSFPAPEQTRVRESDRRDRTIKATPAMDMFAFGCALRALIPGYDWDTFKETEEGKFINQLCSESPRKRPTAKQLVGFLKTHDLPLR